MTRTFVDQQFLLNAALARLELQALKEAGGKEVIIVVDGFGQPTLDKVRDALKSIDCIPTYRLTPNEVTWPNWQDKSLVAQKKSGQARRVYAENFHSRTAGLE